MPSANYTSTTAFVIPALPYTTPQVLADILPSGGPNYDLWYAYTPVAGEILIGFLAEADPASNYEPDLTVWTGTPPALTEILGGVIATFDTPAQVPQTVATTLYYRIRQGSGGAPDVDLQFRVLTTPIASGTAKTLLIFDADEGFPAAQIDTVTGQISGFQEIKPSDWGARLPSGFIGIQDNTNKTHFVIYNATYVAVADVAAIFNATTVSENVTSNRADRFYTAKSSNVADATINAIDVTGSILDTWVLDSTSRQIHGMAPSLDNTILYYTSIIAGSNVYRWDLVNDMALSDLVGSLGGGYSAGTDCLILLDDTLLVMYNNGAAPEIRRYDNVGTLLNTYTPIEAGYALEHIGPDPDDDTTFWVWMRRNTIGQSIFKQIRVSDGTEVLVIPDIALFIGGVYQIFPVALGVAPEFGTSNTCPLIVLPGSEEPAGVVIGPLAWVHWPRRVPGADPPGSP